MNLTNYSNPSFSSKFKKYLIEAHDIPLLQAPPIDLNQISATFSSLFEGRKIELKRLKSQFEEKDTLNRFLEEKWAILNIQAFPIEGHVYLTLDQQDLQTLLNESLGTHSLSLPQDVKKAYLDFLTLNLLHSLHAMQGFEELRLKISLEEAHFEEAYFHIELSLQVDTHLLPIHLLLSSLFLKNLKTENAKKAFARTSIDSQFPLKLSLNLPIESLSMDQWQQVELGDFILLSKAQYQPNVSKGKVELFCGTYPLFLGDLEKDHIKILQQAYVHPKETAMEEDHNKADDAISDKDFLGSDEDFYEEDEELAKLLEEEAHKKKDQEEDESSEKTDVENSLPLSENKIKENEAQEELHHEEKVAQTIHEEKKIITPSQIPVNIRVEIASFTLSAKEVLELQPGNELSIGKEIDNQVNLMVGSKCIAKGELLQIGDFIGVRILEI